MISALKSLGHNVVEIPLRPIELLSRNRPTLSRNSDVGLNLTTGPISDGVDRNWNFLMDVQHSYDRQLFQAPAPYPGL